MTASRLAKDYDKDKLGYSSHKPLTTNSMASEDLNYKSKTPPDAKR